MKNTHLANICVVHLVRSTNEISAFEQFIKSYKKYISGIEHDLLVTYKGFNKSDKIELIV